MKFLAVILITLFYCIFANAEWPLPKIDRGLYYAFGGGGAAPLSLIVSDDRSMVEVQDSTHIGLLKKTDEVEVINDVEYRVYKGRMYLNNGSPDHNATLRLSRKLLNVMGVSTGLIIFSDDNSQYEGYGRKPKDFPNPIEVGNSNYPASNSLAECLYLMEM